MPSFLPIRLLTVGLAVALSGVSIPAHAADTSPDPGSSSEAGAAQHVLAQAKSLFGGSQLARSQRGTGPSQARPGAARDATLVLTRLAHEVDDLSASDRQVARALLARPSYHGTPEAFEHSYTVPEHAALCDIVCIHYVTSTRDAVSGADSDADGIPDYVAATRSTMDRVWTKEITDLGYHAPLSDAALADNGGSAKVDVYLQDLPEGLYGYCVPDSGTRVSPGYCVLDNDYSTSEFPTNTPLENLQVTAAHEFFHAVQFGYDSYEDPWLVEGTAAWMEDEVYDGVNDNRQYLYDSALHYPYVPLDYSDDYYQPYGSWIFWRFLSESTGPGAADNPGIVRKVWEAAVGSSYYSTKALNKVLAGRNSSFSRTFSAFGTWTSMPRRYFSEGAAYRAAPYRAFRLTDAHRSTGLRSAEISHMAHRFMTFSPGSTLTGRWRVRVTVNMPSTSRGSVARLVVHNRNGDVSVHGISLNRTGNGSRVLDFSRSTVGYLKLELVNASTRFSCYRGTYQSCQGSSPDDYLKTAYSAKAIR